MTYRAITAPAPEPMPMWVVYANPSDFPGKHVVRRHEIGAVSGPTATAEHYVGDTLDQVRQHVPGWAIRFEREPADDPVVVEVWL